MEGRHEESEAGTCSGTIPEEGGDVDVRCELTPVPQQVRVEEREVVILEKIHFALDSAEILPESFPLMREIAEALRGHPDIRLVEIQGHTDDQGTIAYNESLSQRRAQSVKDWLVEHDVEESRLEARGYGESDPIAPNDTAEGRARNRRVQFIIQERDAPEPVEEGEGTPEGDEGGGGDGGGDEGAAGE